MIEPAQENQPATAELLTRYVRGDTAAFGLLTRRYYPLVLAAAQRRCEGRQSLAEDAAQQVFIDLARRASSLRADERLGGWLHQRAVRAAGDLMKSETRRQRREAVAAAQLQPESAEPRWSDAAPFIDAALQRLSARDRDAVLLRCVEERDFRDVGSALGLSDDAAQKCVSRALEKLRGLLRRRGVVPALTVLTAGLAADQARATGFSEAATHTAAHALQSAAASASTAASTPWLLHAKAAAAGLALACAAWAWPMVKTVRNGTTAATASGSVTNSQSASTSQGLRPLRFPAPPRMAQGLSVDEIVAAIAALAPMPDTESNRERFNFFAEQLQGTRAGEALQKMRASFPASLIADLDRKYWRHYLLQGWGHGTPLPALDHAWACLPDNYKDPAFESMLSAISTIVQSQEEDEKNPPLEALARWHAAKLTELCGPPRGQRFKRIESYLSQRLIILALKSKSAAALEPAVTLVNDHRLRLFDDAPGSVTDVASLEMLAAVAPQLDAPARRAALMEAVIERLGELDYAAVQKVVEQVKDPAQRLNYAMRVARPPHLTRGTGGKPFPQNGYKKRADWLFSLTDDGNRESTVKQIVACWMRIDAPWGLQWMEAHLPRPAFTSWLKENLSHKARTYAAHGEDSISYKDFIETLPLLLEHLRKADPEGNAAFLEKLRTDNRIWSHSAELNALLPAP